MYAEQGLAHVTCLYWLTDCCLTFSKPRAKRQNRAAQQQVWAMPRMEAARPCRAAARIRH
jgi:hypothetical protein